MNIKTTLLLESLLLSRRLMSLKKLQQKDRLVLFVQIVGANLRCCFLSIFKGVCKVAASSLCTTLRLRKLFSSVFHYLWSFMCVICGIRYSKCFIPLHSLWQFFVDVISLNRSAKSTFHAVRSQRVVLSSNAAPQNDTLDRHILRIMV